MRTSIALVGTEEFQRVLQLGRDDDRLLHGLVYALPELGISSNHPNWPGPEGRSAVYEDEEDPNMIQLDDGYNVEEDPTILSLTSELPTTDVHSIVQIAGEYVNKNAHILGDVYDKDIDHLAGRANYTGMVVAYCNDVYIGHVYFYDIDNDIQLIGIRTTLLNQLRRECNGAYIARVSHLLLSATISYAKMNNHESVILLNPIGGMSRIAQKLGFDEDGYYNL